MQAVIAFIGVIMITDAFSHDHDTLKWIDYGFMLWCFLNFFIGFEMRFSMHSVLNDELPLYGKFRFFKAFTKKVI